MDRAHDPIKSPVRLVSTFCNAPVASEVDGSLRRPSQLSPGVPVHGQPIFNQAEHNVTPPVRDQQGEQLLPQAAAEPGQLELPCYSPPVGTADLLSRTSYLPSIVLDSHSVSQPTSFLRGTHHGTSRLDDHHSVKTKPLLSVSSAQEIAPIEQIKEPSSARSPSVGIVGPIPPVGGAEIQRMSIKSLLLQTSEPVDSDNDALFYGFDVGRPDYDLHKNDDLAAIEPPISVAESNSGMPSWTVGTRKKRSNFTVGGYYASPVRIEIPKHLTPLPSSLLENPVNLMYFHHFLNHTSRLLVPHDCEENPFISVLPASKSLILLLLLIVTHADCTVAISDPNLLNLMLAYSASHRARFLRHPEPATRIAHWVSDVFPALRHALDDPSQNVTDSHLATAIMLLSLKIVSPSTFEVPITWQSHLKLARDLFLARGVQHVANPGNAVALFLARWFAYLDILGSLSCRRSGPPVLHGDYWSPSHPDEPGDGEAYYRVDCLEGFTPQTGRFLARLGHLASRCDNERFDEAGNYLSEWTPSADVALAANTLLEDMAQARRRGHARGLHHTEQENNEMIATDFAFHWATVVHIYRRVLGKAASDPEVRQAVDNLCDALNQIRPGSSAEVSTLFPLFTAGCENLDTQRRLELMTRVMNFESEGLKQVYPFFFYCLCQQKLRCLLTIDSG